MALHAISALRALTYRLASTPAAQLPRSAAQLSASIWTCRELLSAPAETLKRSSTDDQVAVVVHRFRTQLASLLQDRTVEGRWAAVVLTKATIEAGGFETLSKCNTWVRNLLNILKRPDPPSTRALVVLVLTRIFMLTWDHVSLVREITTPALQSFVPTCLSNATNKHCSKVELLNILEAFEVLLPHHPTIFRTNETVLRKLVLRIISASHTDVAYGQQHIHTAQRLLSLLPFVTPKQGGPEKWEAVLQVIVENAHRVCDLIFKPIIEPTGPSGAQTGANTGLSDDDSFVLSPWTGVHAGVARLATLFDTIAAHFETTTQAAVRVRLGLIFDLLSRVLSVTAPQPNKHTFIRSNPDVPKEDRDVLFSALPAAHAAAFRLLSRMVTRLGSASLAFSSACYEHIVEVFDAERFDVELRDTTYTLAALLLEVDGLSLPPDKIGRLTLLLQSCCQDLYSDAALLSIGTSKKAITDKSAAPSPSIQAALPELQRTAAKLLVAALTMLNAKAMPRNLRTLLDRTAIMTHDKRALLGSILNPAPSPYGGGLQTSLLPLLARLYPKELEVEALVRPRMPVIRTGVAGDGKELNDRLHDIHDMDVDGDEVLVADPQDTDFIEDKDKDSGTEATTSATNQNQASAYDAFLVNQQKRSLPADDAATTAPKRSRTIDTASTSLTGTDLADSNLQSLPGQASTRALDEVEDDSDVELPPLTLDEDTDDEDE